MGRESNNKKRSSSNVKRHHSAPLKRNESFMGKFSDAPHYLQDNEHIVEGYRIGFDSPKKVIKSLFMVHNETVNIWTHLVGTIIVLFFIFEGIAY
jgi:adiponectin receptor